MIVADLLDQAACRADAVGAAVANVAENQLVPVTTHDECTHRGAHAGELGVGLLGRIYGGVRGLDGRRHRLQRGLGVGRRRDCRSMGGKRLDRELRCLLAGDRATNAVSDREERWCSDDRVLVVLAALADVGAGRVFHTG